MLSELASEEERTTFVVDALTTAGVPRSDALTTACVLLAADARGCEAHGAAALESNLARIRQGLLETNPQRRIVRETDTSILIDAGNGLGYPAAVFAMERVIEKARGSGSAFGTVRNSNDFGIAAYYAMLALPHDMIGIASSNAARATAPTFGAQPMLGANPLAFAIPANKEPAFVLDFATTQPYRGVLLPLGGAGTETGGHKGYGLGLLVDILCGVLSGGAFGEELPRAGDAAEPGKVSHFFGAVRIDGFRDPAAFKDDMDALLREHKDSEKAPGHDRIYVAGEPEWERANHPTEELWPKPRPKSA